MSTVRTSDDPAARWLGLAVFLIGIALLAFVFSLLYKDLIASGLLAQVGRGAATPSPNVSGAPDAFTVIVQTVGKAILLFLMVYAGSTIAGRGIGMYAAARAPHEV
jgi:hypothetical protein